MRDQDLSNEALIPKVIDLYRFADIKTSVAEAEAILSDLTNGEKVCIITAHKQVIGDPTDV
jgi:hypothetical protein